MRDRLAALMRRIEAASARRVGLDPARRAQLDAVVASLLADWDAAPGPEESHDPDHDPDRVAGLVEVFGLDPHDADLLVVAVGCDVDANVALAYGLLGGGTTPSRPTVALACELAGLPAAAASSLLRLGSDGGLRRADLMALGEDRPWLSRQLVVPHRVLTHLLGLDELEPELALLVAAPVPVAVPGTSILSQAVRTGAELVWVRSPLGTAGPNLAVAAFADAGLRSLTIDLTRCPPDVVDLDPVLRMAAREASLRGMGLVLVGSERLAPHHPARDFRTLARSAVPVIAVGDTHWHPQWSPLHPLVFDAPPLTFEQRRSIWAGQVDDTFVDPLAALRLSPETIVSTLSYAARLAEAQRREATLGSLQAAARRVGGSTTSAGIEGGGRRRASFEDLVLPERVGATLRRLVSWAGHRDQVLADGRLIDVGEKGTGLAALFAGGPGTGKTLAAHVVAAELGLDLFRVELSSVVDKYIGETEKNLERVFHEAESLNVVLFFDEADALFGKRSDVKDAHDRYANQEVAYLLQRMEHFEGITILATNLRGNLDAAFSRRMSFIVSFPDPDAPTRKRLWEAHLGRVDTDPKDPIDVDRLSEVIELAGGDIRNIVLASAYDAVAADEAVGMRHVVAACVREYQKLGRRAPALDFG